MADNIVVKNDAATTIGTLAADDIASVLYPRTKVGFGVDGAYADVSASDPLPITGTVTVTGVATAANQTTGNTALAAIQTAVEIIDNVISGSEMQVDVVTMPTVTVQATNLDVRDLTSVSDSVAAVQSGSWTVDTELPTAAALAENASNPTAPAVGAFGMVWDGSGWDRTPGNSTDGMLVNLGTNNDITIGAALPAGGNTIGDVTISGNALTSLQLLDDVVKTDDAAFTPASDKVAMIGATFDDVASDSVDEGDAGALRMSARRELYTQIRDAAGNERGANVNASGQLLVTGPVTNAGTFVVQVDAALPAGANAIGKLAANSGVTIGAVEIAAAQTLATVTTLSTLTGGGVAHDGADSGNPHKIGAVAETSLSGITLVADGDRTNLYAGIDGVLIVRPHCNLEDIVQERTTNTDGASTAFASGLAAPGANVRLYITNVTIANSSSSFCTVDLRDGAAGSVLWTIPVPATGGAIMRFDPPLKLSANTALAFDASGAITTLSISASGFKSKV